MRYRGITFQLLASLIVLLLLPLLVIPFATFAVVPGSDSQEGPQYFSVSLSVVAMVVLPLMVCTLLTARMIKKKVLNPLKELTVAAEKIVQGNLDFQVAYRSDDEMGRLSSMFELMRQRLVESAQNQQAYEQARNDLIASISHDLRTPLSSIRGYVEGLKDGVARDKAQFDRYLTVIRDKTDKLDELMEDLFQFSELESGHLPISFQEYDSRLLLESLMAPLEKEFFEGAGEYSESGWGDRSALPTVKVADAGSGLQDGGAFVGIKSAKLIVGRPFPEGKLMADPVRLTQVFDNLVGNAVKYAGAGAVIFIDASVSGSELEVTVRDNGRPIAPEHLPHIFDRFYRADSSRSGDGRSSGLGLAICKYIIEEHGGVMGASSQDGEGNRFYFRLPLLKE
ncbi:sensor histidine kinase [Paenibacillus sp. CAU 1782]